MLIDGIKMVKLLVNNGANINVKNKYGDIPISIAKNDENDEIVEYLENKINSNRNSNYVNLNKIYIY